jgi:hypothetical protein
MEPEGPPLNCTICGPAPVLTVSVPERLANALGANFTVTLQLLPTASDVPQVVETKLKSAPLTEFAVGTVTLRAIAPSLARVALCVAPLPTPILPNAKLGVTLALCNEPLPWVADALGLLPALVVMLASRLGTLLLTVARDSLPLTQLQVW